MLTRWRCNNTELKLWRLISGDLTGVEADRLMRHAARCERCQALIESARHTDRLIGAYRRAPMPPSERGWQEVRQRLEVGAAVSPAPDDRRTTPALAWAGVACAAMALCLLLFHISRPASRPVKGPAGFDLDRERASERRIDVTHRLQPGPQIAGDLPAPSSLHEQQRRSVRSIGRPRRLTALRRSSGPFSRRQARHRLKTELRSMLATDRPHGHQRTEQVAVASHTGDPAGIQRLIFVMPGLNTASSESPAPEYIMSGIDTVHPSQTTVASRIGGEEARIW